jgi:hypothetical protein
MDLLCRFGHRFPQLVAKILDRELGKKRRFREETITDLLMAGLVPFEPFSILTDFPVDESATGEDMDWEFVNTHPTATRRYLRLHIQAKRAHPYPHGRPAPRNWWYPSLDHPVRPKPPAGTPKPPKGSPKPPALYGYQHKLLVDHANSLGCCVPIFMFYHPNRSIPPPTASLPHVEGVNWMFADTIPENVSSKAWPAADKLMAKWRSSFHPLHELLCFANPIGILILRGEDIRSPFPAFLVPEGGTAPTPGDVADRLNQLRSVDRADAPRVQIEASQHIPAATQALIDAALEDRKVEALQRRRAIFISKRPDIMRD